MLDVSRLLRGSRKQTRTYKYFNNAKSFQGVKKIFWSFFLFVCYIFAFSKKKKKSRQGSIWPRIASNPWQSFCFRLLSGWVLDMHHHAWFLSHCVQGLLSEIVLIYEVPEPWGRWMVLLEDASWIGLPSVPSLLKRKYKHIWATCRKRRKASWNVIVKILFSNIARS